MNVEDRLYVVMRESVGITFKSYGDLAQHIHEQRPVQFLYTRLETEYCMQVASIVPYVSLAHFLDLLRSDSEDKLTSLADEEPDEDGAKELIAQNAVDRLLAAGFTHEKLVRCCKRIYGANFTVPSQRDIFYSLSLDLTEHQFMYLTSIGKVREYFGYSITYRRVMVPVETAE